MKKIYLDYAAATPLDPEVLMAMAPYFTDHFQNPSATYLSGRSSRRLLENARAEVAGLIGARPAEVIFTSGATESNNLAISGINRKFPKADILVSATEHDSILAPAKLADAKTIPVLASGAVDQNWLASNITDQTVLISLGMVNNEIGNLQSLRDIAELVKAVRLKRQKSGNDLPLYLHTDAAQSPNFFDIHVARLGVDMMSLNGGKIYGPKQSGVLYLKAGVKISPLILGGGQEFGVRAGTENLPAIIGFAKALDLAQARRKTEATRIKRLRSQLVEAVQGLSKIALINGDAKRFSPHIVSITFPGHDNERLMIQLDELGIECAIGSACSASNDQPSHVLKAIGLSDDDARATLRFSFGATTGDKDIAATAAVLAKCL